MDIAQLRHAVAGPVIAQGDAEWDDARLFHSGIGEPELIVRVRSVADVQAAVRFAAEGLVVGVRGGGHSAWGTLPGGLIVDLSALDDVEVDAPAVHVGGGATWGSVAETLGAHGLGLSSGDTASVGVGGLTLGGGIGWMTRAWGLACDQLVGVQLVTAAGDVVEVTAGSHPELFWALRGGGGNFGVVTRFDFEAHPLPGVVWTTLSIDGDAAPLLARLEDVMRDAPRALTVTYMDVPAMDPSAPAGASLSACWVGTDVEAARAVLAPLLEIDGITEVEGGVRRYRDVLLEAPPFDPAMPMPGFVGGNTLLRVLDAELVSLLTGFRERYPASVLMLRSVGGAYGDVAQDDSPFPARTATWFAMAGAFDIPGLLDAEARAGAQRDWDAIEAHGDGIYTNFTVSTDAEIARKAFPPATMARLARVKQEWDPQNVFSRNHNVRPA
ncbi:hypothetical protein ASD65_05290 [Microbacterium sp. Root61]|uniref:FAD-binding oxidoreductase n=1 Tax=Microbacterium sp. Root61 TaxID=1736570 RepID=UPI0006F311D9|nr:FAD-binding protein [Microbacterium sp. Root61]KRA23899.1 hypothetical protein ASD65_05290 [Microbacterium sp. Root61]